VGEWLDGPLRSGTCGIDNHPGCREHPHSKAPDVSCSQGNGAEGDLVTMATAPRVTLLDGFSLRLGGPRSPDLSGDLPRGVQRVLAHLCLCPRQPRSAVAGRLWPDVSEQHAQGSLRSALWRLQKTAPGLVEACNGVLGLAPHVTVDVRELGEWAHRVRDPLVDIDGVDLLQPEFGAELLPGWYDDWVLLERERLRQIRVHALEVVAHRLITAGRYPDALEAAFAAVQAEPLRESAHRILVQAHLAEGNAADALATYDNFRRLLASELGVTPTAQMTGLLAGVCPVGG
jgi:DNA-binding SARP family transcriptional activator